MIQAVSFKNFRNLDGKSYSFEKDFNILIGKNSDGKTNVLEGVRLAFSAFDGNYVKVDKSDFTNSIDTLPIEINVKLKYNSIPSFDLPVVGDDYICGFKVIVRKAGNGRYVKKYYNYDGTDVSNLIAEEDLMIPKVYMMPLVRIDDIYSPGLTTGIANFLNSEDEYTAFKAITKKGIQEQISVKVESFKELCKKFNKLLDVDVSDPRMTNERLYIVDGVDAHNIRIGSGYKSIANVILCTMGDEFNIILIDELENHLHPALLRTLVNEIKQLPKTCVIATTHSAILVNEFNIEEIIDTQKGNLSKLLCDKVARNKINTFLHPGRAELLLADNVILVEGFTEEVILRKYISNNKLNWTVVNVAGVMFEPYVKLAASLGKALVAVSDNDRSESENGIIPTSRFNKLKELCSKSSVKLIEVDNTLETDLYNCGYLDDRFEDLIKVHKKHSTIKISKPKMKTAIAHKIIDEEIDLSGWHVIREIHSEFDNN